MHELTEWDTNEINEPPRRPLWRRWLPVAIWVAVIFYASTKAFTPEHTSSIIEPIIRFVLPKADPSQVGKLNLIVRKSGHVVEYAILALLLAWATLSVRRTRRWWFLISLGLIVLVAASDEFHQLFVPGREGSIRDVLIDTTAGYAALGLVALCRGRFLEPKVSP